MATHPFSLDLIHVASPCPANWDEMSGDDRVRFCKQCSKSVYKLSEMTRAEAEAFVQNHEGRLCAQFYRRADGTVLTADCPVGVWDMQTRFARLWASAAALIGFLTFGAISWGNSQPTLPSGAKEAEGPASTLQESLRTPILVKGEICVPTPAPKSGS